MARLLIVHHTPSPTTAEPTLDVITGGDGTHVGVGSEIRARGRAARDDGSAR